jgi:hypothetical protein
MSGSRKRLAVDQESLWDLSLPVLARGTERPVASPALELRRSLEELLAARSATSPKLADMALFTLGIVVVIAGCSVFWISIIRAALSIF